MFVTAIVVLAASVANIWLATAISDYDAFLHDTHFLPRDGSCAAFLIHYRLMFLSVSVILPLAAVVIPFFARRPRVFIGLAGVLVAAVFQSAFTVHTIFSWFPGLAAGR